MQFLLNKHLILLPGIVLLLNCMGDLSVHMVKHLTVHGMLFLCAGRSLHAPGRPCQERRTELPPGSEHLNIIVLASFPEKGPLTAIMAHIQRFQY
jgi:formate hydrogenlyase subunit 3/multisubunit Na+/H+ antiporter MnhD subunit